MSYASLKPADYWPWLTPVRWLILLVIMFGHASTMPRGPETMEYGTHFYLQPAWLGVQLLFILSGVLTAKSLEREARAGQLLKRRVIRNWPWLALSCLLVVGVLYPWLGSRSLVDSAGELGLYVLQVLTLVEPSTELPGLFETSPYPNQIQGILWTFQYGALAYLATAVLHVTGLLKRRWFMLAVAVTLTAFYFASFYHPLASLDVGANIVKSGGRLGYAWVLGLTVWVWRDHIPRLPDVSFLLGFLVLIQWAGPWTPALEITLTVFWASVMMLAVTSQLKAPALLKSLPDLTAGLFVFHWPVQQATLAALPNLSPIELFALSTPVTITLVVAAYFLLSFPGNLRFGQVRQERKAEQTA